MGKIIQLPEEVFSKIAAGEVIEKPANAVKELIENSLDANSKNIKIRILDSGLKLIEIRDDGIGIEKEDLPLTINRYCTSKIKSEKDLLNIGTFGFRGEALYAISRVSNLYITSKTINSDKTYTLYSSEGKIVWLKEEPLNYFESGTIIKVVDLFFNSPVRKNFVSSNKIENQHIINIVKQIACINFNVSFSLYIDDKLILNYLITNNLLNRVKEVFKNIYMEDFYMEVENYKVSIILSNVFKDNLINTKASNKANLYFYVNNRVILDNNYPKLVKNIFDQTLDNRYYIEGIIKLDIPPNELDVNIHPKKLEVRFLKPIFVKNLIQKAVKEFINTKIKTNIVFLEKANEQINNSNLNQWYLDLNLQKSLNSQQNISIQDNQSINNNINNNLNTNISSFITNLINKIEKISQKESNQKGLKNPKEENSTQNLNQNDFNENEIRRNSILEIKAESKKEFKVLYYWDETYFMVYYDRAFYIVDQHNAHEKIIYSTLINKLILHSQKTLIPIEIETLETNILDLITKEKSFIDYFLNQLGFDFEIKEDKIFINSYPSILDLKDYSNFKYDIKAIFINLIDFITGVPKYDKDQILREIVATFSCKLAVKAGTRLTESEIIYLWENIINLDSLNPNFCPHGRNAIIKIDFKYIDNLFERK